VSIFNGRRDKNLILDPHEKHTGMTIEDKDCGRAGKHKYFLSFPNGFVGNPGRGN
jgi:hypothetical protein